MFEVRKPTKKLKDICNSLGEPYTIKIIDLENVIYRNLGNGFDFEVSGLNNNKKSFDATIYVWRLDGNRIVETISGIKSLVELKDCLGTTATKYLKLSPSDLDGIQNQF